MSARTELHPLHRAPASRRKDRDRQGDERCGKGGRAVDRGAEADPTGGALHDQFLLRLSLRFLVILKRVCAVVNWSYKRYNPRKRGDVMIWAYRKILVAFVLCISTTGGVCASTLELERAVYRVIDWRDIQVSSDIRLNVASALLAYWRHFDERVPRLSPNEREWVIGELGATGERLKHAVNSREFALYQLKEHTSRCRNNANVLVNEISSSGQFEMFRWSKMINCYTNDHDLLIYLRTSGLSNGDRDGQVTMQLSGMILGQIVNIVLPSAMADTMGWTLSRDE